MRRFGSWFVFGSILSALMATGCGKDSTGTPSGDSAPHLQVRGVSACGENTLPVVNEEELTHQTMEVATITVTGYDDSRSSGDMAPGTKTMIYVGKPDGSPGGSGGAFQSTIDASHPAGQDKTELLPYSGGSLQEAFFCTTVGIHRIYAYVPKYDSTGQPIMMRPEDGFPIRCIERTKWLCDCTGQCLGDAMPPDATVEPADAQINEAGVIVDAAPPPPDAAPDQGPPSVWQIVFDSPVDANELSLTVRESTSPGGRSDVYLKWRVLMNGMPPAHPVHVRFEFVAPTIPGVVRDPVESISDANGLVGTLVQSGNTPGQVTVRAIAEFPQGGDAGVKEDDELSPPISISAGLPSLNQVAFGCQDRILSAFTNRVYDTTIAPDDGDRWLLGVNPGTKCTVDLADRLLNRIPAGTPIRFTTEAGSVQGVAVTNADGHAETAHLISVPPPLDVNPNPYEADFTQQLDAQSPIVLNPRDGLVRLVASTRGEEGFFDTDGDHQYTDMDLLRPEDDVGEPFIDANDNSAWDSNETYDDVDGDGAYTTASGEWEPNTVIWRSTVLLWVGGYSPMYSYLGGQHCQAGDPRCSADGCLGGCSFHANGNCPADQNIDLFLDPGASSMLEYTPRDVNGNCLDSREQASIDVEFHSVAPALPPPVFFQTVAPTMTAPLHGCFVEGVPEEPLGSRYFAEVLTPDLRGDPGAPPLIGFIKFDIHQQRPDGQSVVHTEFRKFCVPTTP